MTGNALIRLRNINNDLFQVEYTLLLACGIVCLLRSGLVLCNIAELQLIGYNIVVCRTKDN